jgi:3-hydroxyacyl-CoA dehydrogenase
MSSSPIRSVAVLGAGTMGAQIAAHFANAGVPAVLLDLTEEVAREGFRRTRELKPDPLFEPEVTRLITTGGFDRDLARLREVDWIIEAVVEQVDVKRSLLERVDGARRDGTIVSSNTSGIPIAVLAEGRSDDFRRHWLGTHFFNPPRYLRLLELIPTPDTDPAVVERVARFADFDLGKGVVVAKDTPNFIANHVGIFGIVQILRELESGQYSIEEIDAITGPALGRPKSATLRTADIVGIDVLRLVARNLVERLPDTEARAAFRLPPLVDSLVERNWIGDKARQGFYKKSDGDIFTLDPHLMAYRARQPACLPSLDAARSVEDVRARTRMLFLGQDKVGAFLRRTLGPTLLYTARIAPQIAHSIDDIDRAMKWGFGWELGPFETWDAIGVHEVLDAVPDGPVAPLVDELLRSGRRRFRDGDLPAAGSDLQLLKSARDRQQVVRRTPGASLVDLGDGVLAVEFHSKMNAIGGDTLQMLQAGVAEAAEHFQALVVGNDAPNFSAGANLMLLLLEAQEGNWDEIEFMVRTFQATTQGLRYAGVPVVSCPAGMTLGGGCEVVLHSDRVQSAAEVYMGLVEAGVGLIPAAGGTTEMLARAVDGLPVTPQTDLLPSVQLAFETIGLAKVSTSAPDARRLGFLRPVDAISMNRDRVVADAKALALERVREGYRKPLPRMIPVGGDGVLAALKLGIHLAWRAGRITDHDVVIGRALASVLAGGSLPHRTVVSEQYLLELEREAFLKLCGERKTLERVQHTLKTGKPLRN